MAGARFFIAGLILYIFARSTKGAKPTPLEWRDATIIGASLIMCGNGGVTFAEKYLPSGMVAMLVATVPVYMTLFAWGIGMSSRPSYKTFLALLIGITGVFILTSSHEAQQTNQDWAIGITIPLIGSAIWAGGSLFAKKAAKPSSSNLSIGMQMITGGALLLCLGLAFGEWRQLHFELLSTKSVYAFLYLVFFGSIIAFSAYVWLIRSCSPALVGTYTFVNPVVAVFLGWLFGQETIDLRMISGSIVILVAVGLIILFPVPTRQAEPPKSSTAFELGRGRNT
jgi:drug/metabolite transporter (DMT)-like permease